MDGIVFSLVALILFAVVLGGIVLIHELGHYLTARWLGVRVLEFGIGFPPRAKVLRTSGETLWTLNWLPIGGFVRLDGEDGDGADDPRKFSAKPLWVRLTILVAGVVMNIVLAFVIFFGIAFVATPVVGGRIGEVEAGSPAAQAELVAGDEILQVAGERFEFFGPRNLIVALKEHAGQTIALHIRHADGTEEDVQVTLRPAAELSATRGALGIKDVEQTYNGYTGHDPLTAAGIATTELVRWGGLILSGLATLVDGIIKDPTARPPASGPVGIAVSLAGIFLGSGPILTLYVAGILSVNLGVVNILPLPPLDGGRMLVIVLKRFAGRRISLRAERLTYAIGFVLLMAFIIWITSFDIANLGSP
jgi:regulator of sigma E protease